MALYYVAPHYLFDASDIDQDFDLSCFVLAEDTMHAARLWCDCVDDTCGVTLVVDKLLSSLGPQPNQNKNTVMVYLIGPKLEDTGFKYVPWDQFPVSYITVKEV